jgi:SAM-dependent methyltransferase
MYRNSAEIYDLVYSDRRADVEFNTARVADLLRDLQDARVLEVGAGIGRTLLPIALAHPDTSFTGIDIDAEGLEVLARKARRDHLGTQLIADLVGGVVRRRPGAFKPVVGGVAVATGDASGELDDAGGFGAATVAATPGRPRRPRSGRSVGACSTCHLR